MSESEQKGPASPDLPRAKTKRIRWSFPVVWVVPIVAALVAGYLVFHRVQEYGSEIIIRFRDGSGLKAGETPIRYRGVSIGEVKAVELSKDRQYVEVTARLKRSAASIAQEGARFWIVRPEVGVGNISGLGTIISGPHIEALPGRGPARNEFFGLERAPVLAQSKALNIVLLSHRLGGLKPGSPVFYRGIEVGAIQKADLHTNATAVQIEASIQPRYINLVRSGSKFWNVSGLDVKLGLIHGAEINLESPKSLISGGIAFATKDLKDPPAQQGMIFPLEEEPKKEWLEWTPQIPILPEDK